MYYCTRWSGTWEAPGDYTQNIHVPWQLIKAQVQCESNFDPRAVSPVGARGLLQIMPATWEELTRKEMSAQPFDPDANLGNGIYYLVQQYLHFPEIPEVDDKWKFALASYNGGRGYINKALYLTRSDQTKHNDIWHDWDIASPYLSDPKCIVNGKTPDHKQITNYVKKIMAAYMFYTERD